MAKQKSKEKAQSDDDTNQKSDRVCPKHNIPMVSTLIGGRMVPITDSEGHEIGEKEEDVYAMICQECEYEHQVEQSTLSDQPADIARSIKQFQESPFKKVINKPSEKDFIGKYSRFLMESKSVPGFVAEASCEFLISIALYYANYVDTKGRVLSNEAYRHIADSGHNKSPLYKFMADDIVPTAFGHYNYYMTGRGTSRGITSMVQKEKDGRRIPIIFMKDEDSVLYKADNYNKDMFEGYSDLYDGNIPSNTTNVNGHQVHKKCVTSYWSTGTPISIKYMDSDFFEQGWAWRLLPLMDDSPIPENPLTDRDLPGMEGMTNAMINELKEMSKIGAVQSTPKFMEALNEYYMSVIREKNEIEKRKKEVGTLSIEWVQTESKTKAPEHLIKLAMIHSASRWNVDNGTLTMDLEDFRYAMQKFEFYRSQMIKFFAEWIDKREPVNFTEKTERILQLIRSEKERYSAKLIQAEIPGKGGKPGTEAIWDATADPDGKYVRRSKVLHSSHLPVSGWNGFDAIIDTLVGSENVSVLDARIKQTIRTKDGRESSGYRPIGLIGLHTPIK